MKKILSLLLCIVVITLSFAACKGEKEDPEATTVTTIDPAISDLHEANAERMYGKGMKVTNAFNDKGERLTGVHWVDYETHLRDMDFFNNPKFRWETVILGENEYLNGYLTCFKELGLNREDYSYLFEYDAVNQIPLKDANNKEGRYVLYMFYDEGRLIAEIVIEKQENGHYRIAREVVLDRSSGEDLYMQYDYLFNENWFIQGNVYEGSEKSKIIKAFEGDFSEEKLKKAIETYTESYENIIAKKDEKTVSFEIGPDLASVYVVRLASVDSTDVNVELSSYIDRSVETSVEASQAGYRAVVSTDWWYAGEESWVNDQTVWSYLVSVKDAYGRNTRYYYFRVDYSAYAQ